MRFRCISCARRKNLLSVLTTLRYNSHLIILLATSYIVSGSCNYSIFTRTEIITHDLRVYINQSRLKPLSQISVRVEDMVQHHSAVTTQVRIMMDKLHCPAVFNSGLCRTLVTTE